MFHSAILAAAVLTPDLASAQDKPLAIFFQPCEVQQLNDAITAALTSQGFVQLVKPAPGALTVSIPDKVQAEKGRVSGTTWSFNVAFSRDGSSLGHSEQSCNEKKLSDCTDQLISDIKSVAGMP